MEPLEIFFMIFFAVLLLSIVLAAIPKSKFERRLKESKTELNFKKSQTDWVKPSGAMKASEAKKWHDRL